MLSLDDMLLVEARRLGSPEYPKLFGDVHTVFVDMPDYDVRQKWQARLGCPEVLAAHCPKGPSKGHRNRGGTRLVN